MPNQVSPLIRFSRYAALVVGLAYGYKHKETVKVWVEKDKVVEEKLRKEREEIERIKKEQEAAAPSIFDS